MSRTRRLSLRARMLVIVVGVTTILLLIMGTVSTVVLIHRVDKQTGEFEANLRKASHYAPNTLQYDNTAGYGAVEVPIRPQLAPFALTEASVPQLSNQLLRAVRQKLREPPFAAIKRLAATGQEAAAERLARHSQYLGRKPFDISPGLGAAGEWVPKNEYGGPAMLFVAKPVPDEPGQVRGFIIAELITGAALIALLALAGEWLIGQGLEPLDEMTRTANEISSRGDLTARMPDADDQTEIGRLGTSINTMLDRIQQAFSSRLHSEQKVREFAADASHELRTPLTTIRGYAELYRQGALGPDQLPSAMRRIEQEARRMSTLVAELLELARLDRTSSLDLTETDLASVVRDAVADAIAVEPQRPVRAEAPPRLVAVVDEPRVRQVLANLLGNVRAHTPVSTPVAVRLGEISGGVLIEVADAGPGMFKEDAIRAFDRFHRATDRPARADPEDADRQVNPVPRQRDAEEDRAGGGRSRRQGGSGYGGSGQDGAVLDVGPIGPVTADGNGSAGLDGVAGMNGADRNGFGVGFGSLTSGVGLPGADLGVDLNGVDLNGVDLNGVDLNGSAGLTGAVGSGGPAERGAGRIPAASAAGRGPTARAAGAATAEGSGGSGLGLSIVQAIATAHGGRATLESRPGQGTKVRVWLPVRIVP